MVDNKDSSRKIIELKNVYKIYKTGTPESKIEVVALKDVNLTIRENDFITVMGPSGSGKTTLLNIIGGLDRPTTGSVIYKKRGSDEYVDIASLSNSDLDEFRHDKIAVIFQVDNLLYHLNALENVELPLKFLGRKNAEEKAVELLKRLGLEDRMFHYPNQLSAGERQRVALASALAFSPMVILADEPTGELDSANVVEVMNLFKEVHEKEGVIFFVVTHNPLVAKYGNRYFTLQDGVIQEQLEPPQYMHYEQDFKQYATIDDFGRLVLPEGMWKNISPLDGLISLKIDIDNETIIIDSQLIRASDRDIVNIDMKNRIVLPSNASSKLPKKMLVEYDEDKQAIILTADKED